MNVLFDLDGTLHDKTASLRKCAEFMYEKYLSQSPLGCDEFARAFVAENSIIQPKSIVFSKLAKRFRLDANLELEMLDYFDQSFHLFAQPLEGAVEAIKYLKASGIKTACVTNGRDFFQRNKIEALGLTKYFDVIVTSGELSVKKPDPHIFNVALEKLGAKASECVFVGDSLEHDMVPAKKLGMKTVWVAADVDPKPSCVDCLLGNYAQFIELRNFVV